MFTLNEREVELTIYNQILNPLLSFAVGNSDIGLLFGQRIRPSMVWRIHYNTNNDLTIVDENEVSTALGKFENVKSLSFVFDNFSFPIVALETLTGIDVYRFNNLANNLTSFELIKSFTDCRNPKLIPSNIGDLGSIQNQPYLFYIDETGTVIQRTLKDNFISIIENPVSIVLQPTDILEKVAITQNGKIQLSISKLKMES